MNVSMAMRDKIIELIRNSVDERNEKLMAVIQKKGGDTVLFGDSNGLLDSFGLVNLIVALEAAVEEELGVAIILADERAMSQKHSPFRTVGALADYVTLLVEEDDVRTDG